MAEIDCRVVCNEKGKLILKAPVGSAVNESIPNAVRAAYEKEHGTLIAGISVSVSVRKGKTSAMRPASFADKAAEEKERHQQQLVRERDQAAEAAKNAEAAEGARRAELAQQVNDGFVNPYGFVPFMGPDIERPEGLKQHKPLGHALWAPGTYSGTVAVEFTTVTPLLTTQLTRITDTIGVLTTRRDPLGRPIVAGASVKGAVRSVVEQVTGSRLGVFDGRRPIVRRMVPSEVPNTEIRLARVQEHQEGERLVLRPSLEPSPVGTTLKPNLTVSVPFNSLGGKEDRAEVQTWLQLVRHPAQGNRAAYLFWRALQLEDQNKAGAAPAPPTPPGNLTAVAGEPLVCVRGQLHATGRSFVTNRSSKHDERLFVESIWDGQNWEPGLPSDDIELVGDQYREVISAWQTVIDSFDRYPGQAQTPPYAGHDREQWRALPQYRTVFMTRLASTTDVQLMPGMVTRKRYPALPRQLLDESLWPCAEWDEASPADRMFGWVKDGADSGNDRQAKKAYRGQCGFGSVTCTEETDANIPPGGRYWTLSALGRPRPEQFRFYLLDSDGNLLDGVGKEDGYQAGGHQLAGHKVYPTHRLPDGYWKLPGPGWRVGNHGKTDGTPPDCADRYQSWLAADQTPAKITSAIADWVAPGSRFNLRIRVDNLHAMELGALLWVLNLGARPADGGPYCLKLGRGRPLGFGAVKMTVDIAETRLRTDDQQLDRYRSLVQEAESADETAAGEPAAGGRGPNGATQQLVEQLIEKFDKWLKGAAAEIRSTVLTAARGYTDPIIYPRTKGAQEPPGEPAPALESYRWFVNNERGGKWALPKLADPPYLLGY